MTRADQPCGEPTTLSDQQQAERSDLCVHCGWEIYEHLGMKVVRIGLDVGGVLSKYPYVFRALLRVCAYTTYIEWHIVSDMHPKEEILTMLTLNKLEGVPPERVHSADFAKYGEACKVILAKELRLDMMIDDFGAYIAEGDHARLLVMPNIRQPYYHDHWKTPPSKDGKFNDFGRRKKLPPAVSDDRLRTLERAWLSSFSFEDETALLRERQRIGRLKESDLKLAAHAGHVPARLALGGEGPWCFASHNGVGTKECPRERHHHHDGRCHLDQQPFGLWCRGWLRDFPLEVSVRLAYSAATVAYDRHPEDGATRPFAAAALLAVMQWLVEPTLSKLQIVAEMSARAEHVRYARSPGRLLAVFHGHWSTDVGAHAQTRGDYCAGILQSGLLESWSYWGGKRIMPYSMPQWIDEVACLPVIESALGKTHARTPALVRAVINSESVV